MKVCCLFSGGKDSAYALHRILLSGMEVPVLLVVKPSDRDSYLYHSPGIEISNLYQGMTGIPTEIVEAPEEGESEHLTSVLKDLKARYGLDAICSGALLSDFQRMKFSACAMDAGLISYTPLWRKDGARYMRELLEQGFSYMLLSYSSAGFKPSDLGMPVDNSMLERFMSISKRWGPHPAFEGGEAETLILSAPLFPKRLEVKGQVEVEGEYNARFVIEEAKLA
ncbi:MAG: diphthine--ammonia ligase [Candidatus Thermoplasmatota archaeon]|nr:diphthine--ammonia ligase [Candidatus Thermoplasmatota archaeon]